MGSTCPRPLYAWCIDIFDFKSLRAHGKKDREQLAAMAYLQALTQYPYLDALKHT